MKKIISILSIFALLVSFSDLALAKNRNNKQSRGGVVNDTGKLAGDAVVGTGKVAEGVTRNTGKVIRDIF